MAKLAIQSGGVSRIQTIRWVREAINCGLKEAKDLVEGTTKEWDLGKISFEQAQSITLMILRSEGAVFTIKPYPKKPKPVPTLARTGYERLED